MVSHDQPTMSCDHLVPEYLNNSSTRYNSIDVENSLNSFFASLSIDPEDVQSVTTKDDKSDSNVPILHDDVIKHIFSFCSKSTQFNLLTTSKLFYSLVIPHLYREITGRRYSLPENLTNSSIGNLDTKPEWYIDPRPYVKKLSVPAHYDNHADTSLDLPNLDTLRLTIHPNSPVGWSFCKPSNDERYPYYPASRPCCIINNLQPRSIMISGITILNTPSPLPLPINEDGKKFWSKVEIVALCALKENMKEGSLAEYKDGFLANLPKNIKYLFIYFLSKSVVRYAKIFKNLRPKDWKVIKVMDRSAFKGKDNSFYYGLKFLPETCKAVFFENRPRKGSLSHWLDELREQYAK